MEKIKVTTIKFAVPVSRVDTNGGDLSYYNEVIKEHQHLQVFYIPKLDSFLVHNIKSDMKMYVAKTNVAQWFMNDEVIQSTETSATGTNKKATKKADA